MAFALLVTLCLVLHNLALAQETLEPSTAPPSIGSKSPEDTSAEAANNSQTPMVYAGPVRSADAPPPFFPDYAGSIRAKRWMYDNYNFWRF